MAGLMKILQIKGIVPNLIDGFPVKSVFPNLELQDKDTSTGKNNDIDATANSRNIKFQTDTTVDAAKNFLKKIDLKVPRSLLIRCVSKWTSIRNYAPYMLVGVEKK